MEYLFTVRRALCLYRFLISYTGGVDIQAMAEGQKLYGKFLPLDRDFLSDHGIWRLINGGNAAAAEWLTANVVDEDTCGLASVKTERGHK